MNSKFEFFLDDSGPSWTPPSVGHTAGLLKAQPQDSPWQWTTWQSSQSPHKSHQTLRAEANGTATRWVLFSGNQSPQGEARLPFLGVSAIRVAFIFPEPFRSVHWWSTVDGAHSLSAGHGRGSEPPQPWELPCPHLTEDDSEAGGIRSLARGCSPS